MVLSSNLCYTLGMSTIYLSETANPLLADYFRAGGHELCVIKDTSVTYKPVCSHPDLYLCSLGIRGPIFSGSAKNLGPRYPENIRYNAACTGRYFIHNLKYTAPELSEAASRFTKIHVSQGYTKCNTVIVDETSIITSDQGIYKACFGRLDVLLIQPGHVCLQDFPYGFLGGASGRVEDSLVFNGNLEAHPDFKKIQNFILTRSLELVYFKEYPLEDIGSILWQP